MVFTFSEQIEAIMRREHAARTLQRNLDAVTDSRKRLDCYGSAAFYGVAEAQLEMARHLLQQGSLRTQNDLRQHIVEAAESGIPAAQVLLAECYEQGKLFPQNGILARHLREMASKTMMK